MDVLIHISQQLSNSTTPAFVPTTFQVSSNAAVVNMLFFLSLSLVLIDAFLAMLVKGWLQEFDRGWRKYTVAHLRAQERERRLQELERWKLHELVALLPILTQGSLLLFCIGLIVLIFPLHLPSAILCSFTFISIVGFYGFTLYVPIVNHYAPFSSPVSRLLARGLAILHSGYVLTACNIRRIASGIRFHRSPLPPPLPTQEQQTDSDTSHEPMYPLPSNNRYEGRVGPRSRSDIDPRTHVYVLERLISTTAEAVENIPIFLELLDQPVKDATLLPSNVEKWKELLHITLRLLRDQSNLPVSAAWTLARTMVICYNHKTADRHWCLSLQNHLGSQEPDDQRPRMPLHVLFSSYLRFWLKYPYWRGLCRVVAFLEPSDAADAELYWMVNTFHRAMQPGIHVETYLQFFVAVLTYVSSTEQSRRSKVPLTAAVIYAMHTITSAIDQGRIKFTDGLCILPGMVSTSESVPLTFRVVAGLDALDLWSDDYIQIVKNLLQWHSAPHRHQHHDIQLSLIAALYIDSTKETHARPTFADLLKYTIITRIKSQYTDAYDHSKLATYWYMALSQKPLDQDGDPIATIFDVIKNLIIEHSTLQLPGLHILEIAVKHVHKTAPRSSDWLERGSFGLKIIAPDKLYRPPLLDVDHWVLLYLDTLLTPQPYLLPEEVKELKWSDTPEKVHIAKARLNLYDPLVSANHEAANGPMPDPALLRVFLWSKDSYVCTQAFKWCIELAPISRPSPHGDGDSTGVFIPQPMGYERVEHFIHVLCTGNSMDRVRSWGFLESHLVPKWTAFPSSWCHSFALAFLFSIIHPPDGNGVPAYQSLGRSISILRIDKRESYLPFVATVVELIKSDLSWARLTSLENWLTQLPEVLENHNAHTQLTLILATRREKIVEEALELFAELPIADSWMDG